jgi:hypothetical protein
LELRLVGRLLNGGKSVPVTGTQRVLQSGAASAGLRCRAILGTCCARILLALGAPCCCTAACAGLSSATAPALVPPSTVCCATLLCTTLMGVPVHYLCNTCCMTGCCECYGAHSGIWADASQTALCARITQHNSTSGTILPCVLPVVYTTCTILP